jgi:hypothetical protein
MLCSISHVDENEGKESAPEFFMTLSALPCPGPVFWAGLEVEHRELHAHASPLSLFHSSPLLNSQLSHMEQEYVREQEALASVPSKESRDRR